MYRRIEANYFNNRAWIKMMERGIEQPISLDEARILAVELSNAIEKMEHDLLLSTARELAYESKTSSN